MSVAYDKAIGRHVEPEAPPPVEVDAARAQLQQRWLQSTVTKEFLTRLSAQADELDKQARIAAVGYPTNKNPELLVNLLVRSETIRKIIESCQLQ